jgi:hypothetical protein
MEITADESGEVVILAFGYAQRGVQAALATRAVLLVVVQLPSPTLSRFDFG